MKRSFPPLLLLGVLVSLPAWAQTLYLCEDPKSGKKSAQDTPCQTGKTLRSYDAPDPAEQKARAEASRRYKREFERRHPGTYPPEEYLSDEELAAYYAERDKREAERKRREEEAAIREAQRRAQEAERRALEAERSAQEAKAKAAAAEEAARQSPPLVIVPGPVFAAPAVPPAPYTLRPPQAPRAAPLPRPRCEYDDCRDAPPRREGREGREPAPATGRRPM